MGMLSVGVSVLFALIAPAALAAQVTPDAGVRQESIAADLASSPGVGKGRRMPVQQAVSLANFGSRNGPTEIELGTPYEALAAILAYRHGHDVAIREMRSGAHAMERVPGGWRGGIDPRRSGAARGE